MSVIAHPDYLIEQRARDVYTSLLDHLRQMVTQEKISGRPSRKCGRLVESKKPDEPRPSWWRVGDYRRRKRKSTTGVRCFRRQEFVI